MKSEIGQNRKYLRPEFVFESSPCSFVDHHTSLPGHASNIISSPSFRWPRLEASVNSPFVGGQQVQGHLLLSSTSKKCKFLDTQQLRFLNDPVLEYKILEDNLFQVAHMSLCKKVTLSSESVRLVPMTTEQRKIPDCVPSSFRSKYAKITHQIDLHLHFYYGTEKFDVVFDQVIPVIGRSSCMTPFGPTDTDGTLDSQKTPFQYRDQRMVGLFRRLPIYFKIHLSDTNIQSGQSLRILIESNNQSNVQIRSIRLKFIRQLSHYQFIGQSDSSLNVKNDATVASDVLIHELDDGPPEFSRSLVGLNFQKICTARKVLDHVQYLCSSSKQPLFKGKTDGMVELDYHIPHHLFDVYGKTLYVQYQLKIKIYVPYRPAVQVTVPLCIDSVCSRPPDSGILPVSIPSIGEKLLEEDNQLKSSLVPSYSLSSEIKCELNSSQAALLPPSPVEPPWGRIEENPVAIPAPADLSSSHMKLQQQATKAKQSYRQERDPLGVGFDSDSSANELDDSSSIDSTSCSEETSKPKQHRLQIRRAVTMHTTLRDKQPVKFSSTCFEEFGHISAQLPNLTSELKHNTVSKLERPSNVKVIAKANKRDSYRSSIFNLSTKFRKSMDRLLQSYERKKAYPTESNVGSANILETYRNLLAEATTDNVSEISYIAC